MAIIWNVYTYVTHFPKLKSQRVYNSCCYCIFISKCPCAFFSKWMYNVLHSPLKMKILLTDKKKKKLQLEWQFWFKVQNCAITPKVCNKDKIICLNFLHWILEFWIKDQICASMIKILYWRWKICIKDENSA